MLISDIERNKATDPEKQLERIILLSRAHPVSHDEEHRDLARQMAKKHGFMVRQAGRGNEDRRKNTSEDFPAEAERRYTGERRKESRWNQRNYELLVVAVEVDSTQPHSWMFGERVNLEPVASETPESPTPPESPPKNRPDQDGDYVVHLSGSSHPE